MCANSVILAECPGLGHVRLCSCGCVQLNLGPVTIRLEPAALGQAAALLQSAAQSHQRLASERESAMQAAEWSSSNHLVH